MFPRLTPRINSAFRRIRFFTAKTLFFLSGKLYILGFKALGAPEKA
jgi:hypothetical protein